jgi:hypothetical protein
VGLKKFTRSESILIRCRPGVVLIVTRLSSCHRYLIGMAAMSEFLRTLGDTSPLHESWNGATIFSVVSHTRCLFSVVVYAVYVGSVSYVEFMAHV